ncbi:MAG: DUF421 domain-containing protein [Clostridiales bacterium]|nr:DUF421 domain-containing protein [Clostridiales bacterium]
MTTVFIRTLIIYILLISIIKLMGKRQVGELEISELVSTLLLSELATVAITNSNIPLLYSAVPIIVILSLEIIITYIAIKSNLVKRIASNKPNVLINRGIINRSELERNRISLEELVSELRQKNISDIKDVYYAILEQNGKLSVIPKAHAKGVTVSDMNITAEEKGISHALIIDGHIKTSNLRISGRTEEWLMRQLAELNCKMSDVFFFSVNDVGEINLIKNPPK